MVTYVGKQADLGGGGGLNGMAKSPYEDTAVVTGDISGDKCYIDVWPPVWEGCMGGTGAQEGSAAVGGGNDFSANPAYERRVWKFYKDGFAVTPELPEDYQLLSAAPSFGDGGGDRPRPCGGHVGMSVFSGGVERVYMVDRNGVVRRWTVAGDQSDPTNGTLATLTTLAGVGEGVWIDPNDPTVLFVATRSGLWRLTGVTGATSGVGSVKYTNVNLCYDVCAVDEGGQTVLILATGNAVMRGVPAGAGTTFVNKLGVVSGHGGASMTSAAVWNVVKALRQGGVTRVIAGCANPPKRTNPDVHFETWVYTDGISAANPTWTCCNERGKLVNDQGDGSEYWAYLPESEGGALGAPGNTMVIAGCGAEDGFIDPLDWDRLHFVGQQGHWLFDVGADELYPYQKRLGLTSNWAIFTDPLSPGTFYHVNHDHTFWGTRDRGETYRKNEQGQLPAAHDAGFSVALESGVAISRVWLGYGDRDANSNGQAMFNADPLVTPTGPWLKMGTLPSTNKPFGLAVRRMSISGTPRVVAIAGLQAGGIARGVFSTANPPAVVDDWSIVNGTPPFNLGAGGNNYFASSFFASDDMAYIFDPSSGLWCSRNKGVTWALIWPVVANVQGGSFITPDPDGDPGTLLISVGSGADEGLYRLSGCEVGGATVGNSGVTKTEIKRGTTSFSNPGQVVAHDDGKIWIPENLIPPRMWYSEDSGATWTNIADDLYRRSIRKLRGIAVDSDGVVACSMAGPGIFMLIPDTIVEPPVLGPQIRINQANITLNDPSVTLTPPAITSFTPVAGDPGDSIVITGTDFTGATSVLFNGVEATSFDVDSDTQITAVAPDASTGPLVVTTPGGSDTSTDSFVYNDVEPPVESGVDLPSTGNPEESITTAVVGIWLVDANAATANEPANRVQLLDQEAIPSDIGEASEVLLPIGRGRPVRITDSIRGYEGQVVGYVQSREDRLQIEEWKAEGAELRLIVADLNIPVQLGEIAIERIPSEVKRYYAQLQVEQIGEFLT